MQTERVAKHQVRVEEPAHLSKRELRRREREKAEQIPLPEAHQEVVTTTFAKIDDNAKNLETSNDLTEKKIIDFTAETAMEEMVDLTQSCILNQEPPETNKEAEKIIRKIRKLTYSISADEPIQKEKLLADLNRIIESHAHSQVTKLNVENSFRVADKVLALKEEFKSIATNAKDFFDTTTHSVKSRSLETKDENYSFDSIQENFSQLKMLLPNIEGKAANITEDVVNKDKAKILHRDQLAQDWYSCCKDSYEVKWRFDLTSEFLHADPHVKQLELNLNSLTENCQKLFNTPIKDMQKGNKVELEAHKKQIFDQYEVLAAQVKDTKKLIDERQTLLLQHNSELEKNTTGIREQLQKLIPMTHSGSEALINSTVDSFREINKERNTHNTNLIREWHQICGKFIVLEWMMEYIDDALATHPDITDLTRRHDKLIEDSRTDRKSTNEIGKIKDQLVSYQKLFDELNEEVIKLTTEANAKIKKLHDQVSNGLSEKRVFGSDWIKDSVDKKEIFVLTDPLIIEVTENVKETYKNIFEKRKALSTVIDTCWQDLKNANEEMSIELNWKEAAIQNAGVYPTEVWMRSSLPSINWTWIYGAFDHRYVKASDRKVEEVKTEKVEEAKTV